MEGNNLSKRKSETKRRHWLELTFSSRKTLPLLFFTSILLHAPWCQHNSIAKCNFCSGTFSFLPRENVITPIFPHYCTSHSDSSPLTFRHRFLGATSYATHSSSLTPNLTISFCTEPAVKHCLEFIFMCAEVCGFWASVLELPDRTRGILLRLIEFLDLAFFGCGRLKQPKWLL